MNKQAVICWLEENQKPFTDLSDEIWDQPELGYHEFFASKAQADFLAERGFQVQKDVAGMNTAFIAEWGSGSPMIGFAGEFDALGGLSQKAQPEKEPVEAGAPGHGCGHNLLGVGVVWLLRLVSKSGWQLMENLELSDIMVVQQRKAVQEKPSCSAKVYSMTWMWRLIIILPA